MPLTKSEACGNLMKAMKKNPRLKAKSKTPAKLKAAHAKCMKNWRKPTRRKRRR